MDAFLQKLLSTVVNPLINLMFAAAVVYFVWGVFNYIKGEDNGGDRSTGTKHIMWGIIGLFIMVSAYAIVQIVARTFGIPVR
jgi:hypothetical protein